MRFALGLALVGWMSLPATAQLFDDDTGNTIEWPSGAWEGGDVTTMVSGDFTGDLYRDVVLLDGSQLVLAFGPALFSACSPLDEDGVSDFCALVAPSGLDALIASDATGLRKIWIDYEEDGYVVSDSISDTNWAYAESLQAVSAVGNYPQRVAALDPDGDKVLLMSSPFAPTPSTSSITTSGALALAFVDWNNDGGDDLAVLRNVGLDVYDLESSPTLLDSFTLREPTSPFSGGAIASFHKAGEAFERVAAVVVPPSGEAELWAFDDNDGSVLQSSVLYASAAVDGPFELAAGNVTGNGTDELLLGHADPDVEGPLLFSCTGTGGPGGSCEFETLQVLSIGITELGGQESLPILDDFTADGDVDIAWFFVKTAGNELRVAENSTVNHTSFFIKPETVRSRAKLDLTDQLGQLRLNLDPPATAPSFVANKILVEEWYQHTEDFMQSEGAQAVLLNYPTTSAGWNTLHILFSWPSWVPLDGVTYLTIRAVSTDSLGEITAAGPASLHAVALSEEAGLYLEDVLGAEWIEFLILPEDLTDPTPPSETPDYPPGTFGNTFGGVAGGGNPSKPPGMGNGYPPKAPKPNIGP